MTFQGIVEFGSRSDMEWALDKLDGTELNGRKITLTESKRRRRRSRSASRSPRRSRTKSRLALIRHLDFLLHVTLIIVSGPGPARGAVVVEAAAEGASPDLARGQDRGTTPERETTVAAGR